MISKKERYIDEITANEALNTAKDDADKRRIRSVIMRMNCLARFRSMSSAEKEANLIDSLENGKLFFSTSGRYNDPYDTLMYVDKKALCESVASTIVSSMPDYLERIKKENPLKYMFASNYMGLSAYQKADYLNSFLSDLSSAIEELKSEIKGKSKSICFSKDFLTLLLWSHYADGHSGVALLYDIQELESAKCFDVDGTPVDATFKLHNVIYSAERPDATSLVSDYFLYKHSKIDSLPIDELRAVMLTKDATWEYEGEVRLLPDDLDFENQSRYFYLSIFPKAIVLGSMFPKEKVDSMITLSKKIGCVLYEAWLNEDQRDYKIVFQEIAH